MKHFIYSLFALCSIVLMAAFTAPKGPQEIKFNDTEKIVTKHFPVAQASILVLNNLFSPGALPDRVAVPAPAERWVIDKVIKNDEGREKENRALNGLLRKDTEPDNQI